MDSIRAWLRHEYSSPTRARCRTSERNATSSGVTFSTGRVSALGYGCRAAILL